jgi:hypothetical protein
VNKTLTAKLLDQRSLLDIEMGLTSAGACGQVAPDKKGCLFPCLFQRGGR